MNQLIHFLDRIFQKYTPDPFVIAILLSFLTGILSVIFTDVETKVVIGLWGDGFWKLTTFTLQMVMVLFSGYLVASSPPARKVLKELVARAKSPLWAVIMTSLVSLLASYVNWALGLVVGAILVLEFSRKFQKGPIRVLLVSAYSGFVVWHGGLSGSIPLLVNTPENFAESWFGGTVSLNKTIFSHFNLGLILCVALGVMATNLWLYFLYKDSLDECTVAEPMASPDRSDFKGSLLFAAVFLFGLVYLVIQYQKGDLRLDLNTISFVGLIVGLLLYPSLSDFLGAAEQAAGKTAPLLLQYPLYAGIMGILTGSGLAKLITDFFTGFSSAETIPLLTFWSAGLLNFFIPSGGGQWAVQGPIAIPTALALEADVYKTAMAVAWGDAWTNLIQPFWALPLLAITGLKIRDIMGFCLLHTLISGVIISLGFYLF